MLIAKLATNTLFALIGNVKSLSVDTTVVPSVQLVNVYPTVGTALTVTEAPALYKPPPVVVPPAIASDESVTEY